MKDILSTVGIDMDYGVVIKKLAKSIEKKSIIRKGYRWIRSQIERKDRFLLKLSEESTEESECTTSFVSWWMFTKNRGNPR